MTKPVTCCGKGAEFLFELSNDLDADPGYRHVRMAISQEGRKFTPSVRVRFCPFCGFEFKGIGLR